MTQKSKQTKFGESNVHIAIKSRKRISYRGDTELRFCFDIWNTAID